MRGIFICVPVWGEQHAARFVRYGLPCLLAPGNVPVLTTRWKVALLVHTSAEDRERMRPELRGWGLDVVWIEHGRNAAEMTERLHPGHRHGGTVMRHCHNFGIKRAWEEDFGICPIVADEFFADGWGLTILDCLAAGKRAVMEAGYSPPASFLGVLDEHRRGDAIVIQPAEASRRMLQDGAPPTVAQHDDTRWALSWSTADRRGYLVRPHHIPVGFIWAERGPVVCLRGEDNDLAHQALGSWDAVHLVTSTARHFTGGVGGMGDSAPAKPSAWDEARARCTNQELQAIWLKHACNDWHKRWMRTNFWCEDGTLDPVQKREVERHADRIVAESFEQLVLLERGQGRPEMLEADRLISTWW